MGADHPYYRGEVAQQLFNIEIIMRPGLIEVLSALLRGEAQIVGGVLELAYYRAAGDGQAFPTRKRHRVLD